MVTTRHRNRDPLVVRLSTLDITRTPCGGNTSMSTIRRCRDEERAAIRTIINAAAQRYRQAIPADCWHEPYMTEQQLARDIAAGVTFWASVEDNGEVNGVMGLQQVKDVTLIRHAYVRPDRQGRGIGGALLQHLETLTDQRILIGTWADASWAIRFYEGHGYELIAQPETPALLSTYWDISPRQVETSVVLAKAARPSDGPSFGVSDV
jgi:GNAT superfamily N-acetyltransferase